MIWHKTSDQFFPVWAGWMKFTNPDTGASAWNPPQLHHIAKAKDYLIFVVKL